MKTEYRKEALLWGIVQGSEKAVDRLLDFNVELPEVSGDFFVSINGIPACTLNHCFAVSQQRVFACESGSLHRSIRDRSTVKAAFPAAVVAIKAGNCPRCSSIKQAA